LVRNGKLEFCGEFRAQSPCYSFRLVPVTPWGNEDLASRDPADATMAALEVEETRIEQGLEEIGSALWRIQEGKLYRASGYESFAEYVEHRWKRKRTWAYRQITAVCIRDLLPAGNNLRERHARAVAPLEDHPDLLREAWETVERRHGLKGTAAQLKQAVWERIEVGTPVSGEYSVSVKETQAHYASQGESKFDITLMFDSEEFEEFRSAVEQLKEVRGLTSNQACGLGSGQGGGLSRVSSQAMAELSHDERIAELEQRVEGLRPSMEIACNEWLDMLAPVLADFWKRKADDVVVGSPEHTNELDPNSLKRLKGQVNSLVANARQAVRDELVDKRPELWPHLDQEETDEPWKKPYQRSGPGSGFRTFINLERRPDELMMPDILEAPLARAAGLVADILAEAGYTDHGARDEYSRGGSVLTYPRVSTWERPLAEQLKSLRRSARADDRGTETAQGRAARQGTRRGAPALGGDLARRVRDFRAATMRQSKPPV